MVALHDGDWEHAEASPASYRSQASGLVAAHLQWHLERQLRTLPLVEREYRRVDRVVPAHRLAVVGQDMAHGFDTGRETGQEGLPQLPPAPDDYPTFPDVSTWPVVFPELPANTNGRFSRPPQHTSKAKAPEIPADQLPNHVAVVMDGNGRWAKQRGLARTEGHKMGEAVLIDITCGAIELGIKHLSVYAFSTENWKRSAEEVRFLMGFNREVVRRRRESLDIMGVNMRWVGSRPRMWRSVIKEFDIAEEMTIGNDVITVNYCVNYGGRTEIAEATKEIARKVAEGKLNPERITEETVARNLHRPDIPDVDLFIRTSGSSARATSCSGSRPTRSSCSRTSCGPTMTVATCGRPARSTCHAIAGSAEPDELGPAAATGGGADAGGRGRRGGRRRVDGRRRRFGRVAAGGGSRRRVGDGVADPAVGLGSAADRQDPRTGGRARLGDAAGHRRLGGKPVSVPTNGASAEAATRKSSAKKVADVMLRYNFPCAGLTDDALRTLILLVLAGGADVRAALLAN